MLSILRPRRAHRVRLAAAAVALVATGGLSACSTSDVVSTGSSPALEVDGRTILTRDELKAELRRYGSDADYMLGKADPVAPDANRFPSALTLDRLNHHLRLALMSAVVKELKLQLPPADDAMRVEAIQNLFPTAGEADGAAAFAKLPKQDQDDYLNLSRQIAAVRVWIDPEVKRVQATLGTPQEYFAANRDEFQDACIRHILVGTVTEAQAVRARLAKGEDWKVVAAVSTDTGSAETGGELPCGPIDRYVPPFAQAARTLKLNELSQPIQTQFGYHILQVTKRSNAAFDATAVGTRMENAAAEQTLRKVFTPMEALKVTVPAEYGSYRSGGFVDFPQIVAADGASASPAAG